MKSYCVVLLALVSISARSHATDIGNLLIGSSKEHSPVNLVQSIKNTPGMITSISSSDISNYGFQNVTDVLKFVPGFTVRQIDLERYHVSYHDSSFLHIQVLINGRSQQGGVRAKNQLQQFPVPIDQIERINIYRGSNAAKFGNNAFSAVIDVLTKKSVNTGSSLRVGIDSLGTHDSTLSLLFSDGTHESSTYLKYRQDQSFAYREAGLSIDESNDQELSHEPGDAYTGSIMSSYRYTKNNVIGDVSLLYAKTKRENTLVGAPPINPAESSVMQHYSISGVLAFAHHKHNHQFYLDRARWDKREAFSTVAQQYTVWPELGQLYDQNPLYVDTLISGGIPTGGTQADDRLRDAVLYQLATDPRALAFSTGDLNNSYNDDYLRISYTDNILVNDNFSLEVALSYESVESYSPTFFGIDTPTGDSERLSHHLYAEFNFDPVVVNAGYYAEKLSTLDDDILVSPLLGVNYHLGEHDTLKLVYSEAFRTPDLAYTHLDWRYKASNITPALTSGATEGQFYLRHQAPEHSLEPAWNQNVQLVYTRFTNDLLIEVGAFYDSKENVIFSAFNYLNYEFTTSDYNVKGVESSLQKLFKDNQSLSLVLNRMYNDAERDIDSFFIPELSGSLQYSYRFLQRDVTMALNIGHVQYSSYEDTFATLYCGKRFTSGWEVFASGSFDNDLEYSLVAEERFSGQALVDVSQWQNEYWLTLGIRASF